MSIITLTGYKGGIGKTTAAICLAALLSDRDDVLLIDSDLNRSATLWARQKLLPFPVCSDLEAPRLLNRQNYKHIIIDTPARPAKEEVESLARGCDLMILPTTPDPLAIAALAQITQVLPAETKYRCLLTMVPPKPQRDGIEAMEVLQQYNLPTFRQSIRRLKVYIRASDQGLPVSKVPGAKPAWAEWIALGKELSKLLT